MKKYGQIALLILLILIFPLFFSGMFFDGGGRVYREVWNSGHLFFFGGLTYILLTMNYAKVQWRGFRFFGVFAIVVTVAVMVEGVQVLLPDRTPDLGDLFKGIAGSTIVLLYFSPEVSLRKRLVFYGSAAVFLCYAMFSLVTVVYDEISMYRSFPLLSGLESPYEIKRWSTQKEVRRVTTPVKTGRYALEVRLAPGRYPGVSLKHFPRNWKGAKSLQFSVFNPDDPFVLHYRLHDRTHEEHIQRYDDRFNDRQEIEQGWNMVEIPMTEVKRAPVTREMDLENMRNLTIFLVGTDKEQLFYIDDVLLKMSR